MSTLIVLTCHDMGESQTHCAEQDTYTREHLWHHPSDVEFWNRQTQPAVAGSPISGMPLLEVMDRQLGWPGPSPPSTPQPQPPLTYFPSL